MMNMRSLLPARNPVFDLSKLEDELDRFMGQVRGTAGLRSVPRGTFPAVNVYESPEQYLVTAEIPGIDPQKLSVTLLDNVITLEGERPSPDVKTDAKDVTIHRNERAFGHFRRSLSLPGRTEPDDVQARYENGVLSVRVAKARESRARRIEVKPAH